jgi:hypothetical protein
MKANTVGRSFINVSKDGAGTTELLSHCWGGAVGAGSQSRELAQIMRVANSSVAFLLGQYRSSSQMERGGWGPADCRGNLLRFVRVANSSVAFLLGLNRASSQSGLGEDVYNELDREGGGDVLPHVSLVWKYIPWGWAPQKDLALGWGGGGGPGVGGTVLEPQFFRKHLPL